MGSAYAKATPKAFASGLARQRMIKTGDGFPSPWTGYVVASDSRPESGLLDLRLHFGIGDRAKRYPSPENSCSRKLSEFEVETSGGVICFLLHSGREAGQDLFARTQRLHKW